MKPFDGTDISIDARALLVAMVEGADKSLYEESEIQRARELVHWIIRTREYDAQLADSIADVAKSAQEARKSADYPYARVCLFDLEEVLAAAERYAGMNKQHFVDRNGNTHQLNESENQNCICGNRIIRDGVVVMAHWNGSVCQECEAMMFEKYADRVVRANADEPDEPQFPR